MVLLNKLTGLLKKYSRQLKYILSSVIAFAIDYTLLLIFDKLLPVASLEIGALIAWCVSSAVNFTLNRCFVFRSDAPLKLAIPEYYGLAGVVFVLKTYVLLELLTKVLKLPVSIAKPICEVVFFVMNYFVQKIFIFPQKKNGEKNKRDA